MSPHNRNIIIKRNGSQHQTQHDYDENRSAYLNNLRYLLFCVFG
ncbi:DUF559 domain-containing protein, partial [Kingella kingae]